MLYKFNFLRKNAVRAQLAYEAILFGLFISPRSLASDAAVEHTSTYEHWDIETISSRQEMMKKLMMEIWKPSY